MRTDKPEMRTDEPEMRADAPGIRPDERGVRTDERGVRADERGVRADEREVRTDEPEMRTDERRVRTSERGAGGSSVVHRRLKEAIARLAKRSSILPKTNFGKAISYAIYQQIYSSGHFIHGSASLHLHRHRLVGTINGMPVHTRFAPSPTGQLHLGHVLAARIAHSLARDSNGIFLLRHEDIDGPRVREKFYQEIEKDLEWLGLRWDGVPLRQTHRIAAHTAALRVLLENQLVYPCFCTRREIQEEWARIGAAPQGSGTPIYPGACRQLTAEEQQEKIHSGITYAWRLDANKTHQLTGPLTFHDLRFGEIPVNPKLLGDVVLARKEIGTSYHLAVVVDDAFQEITHVTRGEDLLASTHVHRLLQALLEIPAPIYLHHPLMLDDQGKRLAKRNDSLSIASLRENGVTPSEVLARVEASLGL